MQNKKIFLTVIIPQILIFLSLYIWLRDKSGGDMAFVLFNIAFAIINLLVWGIVSFNWLWNKKKVVIISFVLVFVMEFLLFRFIM